MDLSACPAVVLTREHEDNVELAGKLRALGIEVREIPCLSTRYLKMMELPDGRTDALVFTSRRGVRGWVRLGLSDPTQQRFSYGLVAAVGEATAAELEAARMPVDLIAQPPKGRVLAEMLLKKLTSFSRVVMVGGNLKAGGLGSVLKRAGFRYEHMNVYENVKPNIPVLKPFPVAAVYVASPSAAQRLIENNPWFKDTLFCVIGPTTASALVKLGVSRIHQVGAGSEQVTQALYSAYRSALS